MVSASTIEYRKKKAILDEWDHIRTLTAKIRDEYEDEVWERKNGIHHEDEVCEEYIAEEPHICSRNCHSVLSFFSMLSDKVIASPSVLCSFVNSWIITSTYSNKFGYSFPRLNSF